MFGISFTELVLILVVALVVLGPQRLPGMLRTVGAFIHKLRQMTTEVRAQTGIDDLLRQEGFSGGLSELRSLLRGEARPFHYPTESHGPIAADDPYAATLSFDTSRERPVEGPDSYGALADDLFVGDHSAPPEPRPPLPVDAADSPESRHSAGSVTAAPTDSSSGDP